MFWGRWVGVSDGLCGADSRANAYVRSGSCQRAIGRRVTADVERNERDVLHGVRRLERNEGNLRDTEFRRAYGQRDFHVDVFGRGRLGGANRGGDGVARTDADVGGSADQRSVRNRFATDMDECERDGVYRVGLVGGN